MLKKVSMVKELFLTVDNKIGMLNKISGVLSDRGINIEGVIAFGMSDINFSTIMMVVDDSRRASDALKEKKINSVEENDAIMVEMANTPGALSATTKILTQLGINISYVYATTSPETAPVRVVLSTDNNEKAFVALRKSVSA
jgi:hypothetical protein